MTEARSTIVDPADDASRFIRRAGARLVVLSRQGMHLLQIRRKKRARRSATSTMQTPSATTMNAAGRASSRPAPWWIQRQPSGSSGSRGRAARDGLEGPAQDAARIVIDQRAQRDPEGDLVTPGGDVPGDGILGAAVLPVPSAAGAAPSG
jgi:hypothetical protein